MENFANDIAAKMGNILSSKEHQNLFKKASDQTCCNNDCKCSSESCPCKKDKKTCSKSCGSCSSKKEATQNILSRLLRLSEALDQQGFEKQASTILKVFAALHRFDSIEALKDTINTILDQLALRATGRDKEKAFALMKKVEVGHLLPVVEVLPSLARTYEIELPKGFAAGAMQFFDDFIEGRGEGDKLNADDSNDLKLKDIPTMEFPDDGKPYSSLSDEIAELEADPAYQSWEDENLINPHTPRSIFKEKPGIDRFLEGDGEDDLSADDCGEIRLPSAEKSPRVDTAEQGLITLLGDGEPIENVDSDSFDEEDFQRFLEGEGPETEPLPNRKRIETLKSPIWEDPIADTEPARVSMEEFPSEDSPYSFALKPNSLDKYRPRDTLRSSAFMKLDKYFKKDAKDEAKDAKDKKKPTAKLPEKIAKWLSVAASVVLKNSGKKFSEKEQSLFKKLSEAAKAGEARPKHLNRLIAFCEEHKLNVPPTVHELAKTAAYGLFDGNPRGTGTDLEAEDFLDEDDEDEESNPIRKIMLRIYNSSDFQEKLNNEIEPTELSKELAEETAIEMDHPEWLDDPDHEVFDTAYEILEDERFENPEENEYEDF